MSGYPDDGYDRNPDDRDRGDSRRDAEAVERARRSAGIAGTFLALHGLFGLVCIVLLSIPMIFQPELIIDAMRGIAAKQPPGPERAQMEKDIEEMEDLVKQDRLAVQIENVIKLGFATVTNILAIVGGLA